MSLSRCVRWRTDVQTQLSTIRLWKFEVVLKPRMTFWGSIKLSSSGQSRILIFGKDSFNDTKTTWAKLLPQFSKEKNHLNDISTHNHTWHCLRLLTTHHRWIILTTHHFNQTLEENAKCSLFLVLRRSPNSSQMLFLPPTMLKSLSSCSPALVLWTERFFCTRRCASVATSEIWTCTSWIFHPSGEHTHTDSVSVLYPQELAWFKSYSDPVRYFWHSE